MAGLVLYVCGMNIDGAKVVALREARGWSTHQLAKHAGVSYSTVRGIEPTPTRPATAKKLADALGVDVADLKADSAVAVG